MERGWHRRSQGLWRCSLFLMLCQSLHGLLPSGSSLHAADRPNIVMIAIDDLNDWVGCLQGNPQAQTPHIDTLAQKGMLFTNAHCQAPLCNSSRASLLSGRRPSSTGVYALEPWLKESPVLKNCTTLPEFFRKQGYQVHLGGKIFHGNYPPEAERALIADSWGPPGVIGIRPQKRLVADVPGGHPLVDWGEFPHDDRKKGDWKVASWGVQHLKKQGGQPYFLAVGFFLPHVPCYASPEWFERYPEETTTLPEVPDNDRDDIPEFAWNLHWQLPEPRLSWLKKNGQWKNLVRSYLASITFVDSQVGRIVEAVSQRPDADNTIIVLWSDHGWHLGEKGVTGKNTLWRESTRVPLIFAGPGIAKGRCAEPAELLDIYPTLAQLIGVPIPEELEGHSLQSQLKDPTARRAWPAITTHGPGNHSVVTDEWRYIRYANGSDELYHIKEDPREWKNLSSDPTKRELIAGLQKWIPTNDAVPVPGSKSRLLEQREGVWYWEGAPINPTDAVK